MTSGDWVSTSAPYVAPRRDGQPDAWTEEVQGRGGKGGQRIVHAGEVAAPADVADGLGVPVGETVVVRRRVMYLDDSAVELTDTYYPLDLAHGTPLARTAKIPGGAVTLLASMGHTARRVHEEVYARTRDDAEAATLTLAAHEPVLCLTRVTEDDSGPFQVDVSVFPAARQRLRYDLRIG